MKTKEKTFEKIIEINYDKFTLDDGEVDTFAQALFYPVEKVVMCFLGFIVFGFAIILYPLWFLFLVQYYFENRKVYYKEVKNDR